MDDTSPELLERLASSLADRYRVIRLLGQGGMATVYLADDLRHNRVVAVKVLRPELTEGVGSERFLREINTSARLNHPHILPLLDSGRAGELLFYVMPFVEGESLRDRLKRDGRLPLDDAARVIAEIADGLGYAHRTGIVHRDIKPENILLSSGHAVITDFGIARALDQAGDSQLTRTGTATGTPYYMSPEQWDSAPDIDGRSDQYALGCMAHEMLIGQRPFAAPTNMALMLQHLTAPIPGVRSARPDVPEHVEAAIKRAMAKLPEERFATSDDFASALRSSTAQLPVPAAPTAARRIPKLPSNVWKGAAAAVLLAVVAYAGFSLQNRGPSGPTRLAVLPFQNQGPSSEAYFADGVSEEITNRLASVASLTVIDRRSTAQYRGSSKTSRQIGDELDVEYLIEGSVRWAGQSSNQNSVRVTAQLIRASDGGVLLPYDTTTKVDDVFAIQAGIAERVTEKLSVALLQPERQRLAIQHTEDIEAYRNYLQGNSAYDRSWSRQDVASALAFYRKAVELDPNFALAWARLSRTHSWMNQLRYDLGAERLVEAKAAADRAIALDPNLSDAHLALGLYWYWGFSDYDRALPELLKAKQLQASNAQAALQIGNVRRRQGRFGEAIASYRQSADLNPRSHNAWFNLGETLLYTREYDQATPFLRRATELAPDFLEAWVQRARLAISGRGDVATARQLVTTAEDRIPPTAWRPSMVEFVRITRPQNLQEYLQRLRPGTYGLDSTNYHSVRGRYLAQLGRRAEAAVEFDSARMVLEKMRDNRPAEAWIHASLGTAYAGMNRPTDAVAAVQQAIRLLPVKSDALDGPELLGILASVYVTLGNADSAAVYFDRALSSPSWISINLVKADPLNAAFLRTPQFAALAGKVSARESARARAAPPKRR